MPVSSFFKVLPIWANSEKYTVSLCENHDVSYTLPILYKDNITNWQMNTVFWICFSFYDRTISNSRNDLCLETL